MLLKRQFPTVGFKVLENCFLNDFLDMVREQQSSVISTCVLFSSTLLGTYPIKDSLIYNEESSENLVTSTDVGQKAGILGPVTKKDAIEILIRAPMLSDLNSWSHWDLIFAPSLGPLVCWLLNKVNTKELLCLVTRDGKVLIIQLLPIHFWKFHFKDLLSKLQCNFYLCFHYLGENNTSHYHF